MRLIFMGTPESAVPVLRRCVEDGQEIVAIWTQPDRPAGRGNKLKIPPIKEFAVSRGLPVFQPQKIRTDEAVSQFRSHDADAAIVVAYGRILPKEYLRVPRLGCINVHFSLLPKYRGAAPVNWAIVRGERVTGVSTMLIDEGLDTGPILLQRETEIFCGETAPELLNRLSVYGADLLSETLRRFGEITPRPQTDDYFSLAPILKREDGLIEWSSASAEIERRVRGFQPWPNAYTYFDRRRLVVWKAEVLLNQTGETENQPGRIAAVASDEIIVECGGGTALKLQEVQLEGKQRMSARDFINGMRLTAGQQFGQSSTRQS